MNTLNKNIIMATRCAHQKLAYSATRVATLLVKRQMGGVLKFINSLTLV